MHCVFGMGCMVSSGGCAVMQILNRIFGRAEEINGHNRCPTYLYRWTILSTRWGKVYLHKFVGDDWSLDLHDHPKRFISIGLRGSYLETHPDVQPAPGPVTSAEPFRPDFDRSVAMVSDEYPFVDHEGTMTYPVGHVLDAGYSAAPDARMGFLA
jgi:hypothetical protein